MNPYRWILLEHVEFLLEHYPHLRDNDHALIGNIWVRELKKKYKKDFRELSAYDMMMYIVKGKVTQASTITRARRKAQEEHIHLRGDRYDQRKDKATKSIKNNLGYPKK